jgi:hypothetical protein
MSGDALRIGDGDSFQVTADGDAFVIDAGNAQRRVPLRNGRRVIVVEQDENGGIALRLAGDDALPQRGGMQGMADGPSRIIIEDGRVTVVPVGEGSCTCGCCPEK